MAIGSGAAGLPAAIEARQRGLDVLLACKGSIGRGTSTSFADGGFTVATPWHSVERNFRDTLEAGRYLNNEALVTMLVREGRRAVDLLTKFGLELHPTPKGWHLLPGAGHPYIAGIALSQALVGAAGAGVLPSCRECKSPTSSWSTVGQRVHWPYRRASATFSPGEGTLSGAAELRLRWCGGDGN